MRQSRSLTLNISLTFVAELVDAFLNGPRTLSKDLLSKILISRPPPVAAGQKAPEIYPNPSSPFNAQNPENEHFEFMFFSGHFLGDGVSFAVIANEFLTLLASDMAEEDLSVLVQSEIDARVTVGVRATTSIPTFCQSLIALLCTSPRPTPFLSARSAGSPSPDRSLGSRRACRRSSS